MIDKSANGRVQFLGLRKMKGISKADFKNTFFAEVEQVYGQGNSEIKERKAAGGKERHDFSNGERY